jgi:hypothetical protein
MATFSQAKSKFRNGLNSVSADTEPAIHDLLEGLIALTRALESKLRDIENSIR